MFLITFALVLPMTLLYYLIIILFLVYDVSSVPSSDKSIVVVGSVNADVIIPIDSMPILGETVVALEKDNTGRTVAGGKGANQAVSCRRLGAVVSFFCQFGCFLVQYYSIICRP